MGMGAWDITSATGRWVTPGAFVSTPVWSKDGRFIFFGSYPATATDQGEVQRIGADGQGLATIAKLDRFGGLEGIPPHGRGLLWPRGQAAGAAAPLGIPAGANQHPGGGPPIVAWRGARSRA